jgi:GT2 family glycosyltransferase/glycosyltransferase involved in cell wall biosynthesis
MIVTKDGRRVMIRNLVSRLFRSGEAESELFDKDYYLSSYPDVAVAGIDPFSHYMQYGWREGRNPSASFCTLYYKDRYLGGLQVNPLEHHTGNSATNIASPIPSSDDDYLEVQKKVVGAHFDEQFYRDRYADLNGMDALEHYLRVGWREGRDPSPGFSTVEYLRAHPNVAVLQICPFYHYVSTNNPVAPPRPASLGNQDHSPPVQVHSCDRRYETTARIEHGLTIVGTALDPLDPQRSVEVVASLDDGTEVARVRADRMHRIQLDGIAQRIPCGFKMRLPATLIDGAKHQIVLSIAGGLPFAGGPLVIDGALGGFGNVEAIHRDRVTGWALSYLHPTEPPLVEILVGGRIHGSGVANKFRPDVASIMRTNGFNGFDIALEKPLRKADLARLVVRLQDPRTHMNLSRELLDATRNALEDDPEVAATRPGVNLKGDVNKIQPAGVTGWAIDLGAPTSRVSVDLLIDDLFVGSAVADASRPDVGRSFQTHGRHGFSLGFPLGLGLSGEHKVTVLFSSNKAPVPGTPKMVSFDRPGLAHPAPEGGSDRFLLKSSLYRPARRPAVEPARVALIVLNLNGASHLENFFSSFYFYNSYEFYRILVIDHGSVDESQLTCQNWADKLNLRFIQRGKNWSFSASNNFAADQCGEELLLFINNDIIFSQCILSRMVGYFDDPLVGILGVKLRTPPIKGARPEATFVQHLGVKFGVLWPHRRPYLPYELPLQPSVQSVAESAWRVPAVTAGLMMVRRNDFQIVGGFDERYFYGYEDVDFCLTFQNRVCKEIICANDISAYHHRGATRLYEDAKTRERFANNLHLLEARFGASLRQEARRELFSESRFYRLEPLRIAFAVSTTSMDAAEGDFFTAYELGEQLTKLHGWEIQYLPPDAWYDVDAYDVIVAMRHDFDPRRITTANSNLVIVAWARNWFDQWLDGPTLHLFDVVWAASSKAAKAFAERVSAPVDLIRIATNEESFNSARSDPNLASDYCFTGSFFGSPRKIIDCLDPEALPYRFALFGHHWKKVGWLSSYWQGALPYPKIPDAYGSTRVVLDDANFTVAKWGSVNSRVFDALASGALVLTNGSVGAAELFGDLLPVYDSQECLAAQLNHYLGDEEARRKLTQQLRAIVLSSHTYKHRAREVHASLRRFFVDSLRFSIRPTNHITTSTMRTVTEVLRDGLRKNGIVVRSSTDVPAIEENRRSGDDVVIFVTGDEPEKEIQTPQSLTDIQLNVRFHLGNAADLWLKDCARYDALLLVSTAGLTFSAEELGHPVIALFPNGTGQGALFRDHRGELVFGDLRAFRTALEGYLPDFLGLVSRLNAEKIRPTETERIEDQQTTEVYVDESIVADQADLVFYPDYSSTNPYQQLLYRDFSSFFSVRAGDIRQALALQKKSDLKRPVVFHLHWTSVIIGNASTRSQAANQLTSFLEAIQAFLDNGGRLIWTIHNILPHEVNFPDLELELCQRLGELASCIHVHSARVVELTERHYRLPAEKVIVAEHGSYIGAYPDDMDRHSARASLGLGDDDVAFVFLGQLRSYKGIDELIAAFAELRQSRPSAKLIIAGNPVRFDAESIRRRVADAEGITLVLEHVPDGELQRYLRAADYVVLPYRNVLTSGSAYLALSFGVPVIAPDQGILPDVLRDGIDSFLYSPDDPNGLLLAMTRAAANTSESMRASALARAGSFDWHDTRDRLARAVIGSIVGEPASIATEGGERQCAIRLPLGETAAQARVAAIVLHYADLSDTVRCVSSLLSQSSHDCHVYIVSNDPDGRSFAYLARIFPGCTVIQSPGNLGYGGGNNLALAALKDKGHDYVWIVNPDAVAPENLLRRLIELGDQHQDVSIFGSKITFGDRPDVVWFGGGVIEWDGGLETKHLYIGKPSDSVPKDSFPCDYVTGASLFFRSSLLDDVGFIPERYFLYFEETHWCLAASALGHRIMMFPETHLFHYKRSESEGLMTLAYLYYFSRNIILMCTKFAPGKVEDTIRRLRRVANIWLDRIKEKRPARFATAFDAVERGLADGLAGVEGKSDLSDLERREKIDTADPEGMVDRASGIDRQSR